MGYAQLFFSEKIGGRFDSQIIDTIGKAFYCKYMIQCKFDVKIKDLHAHEILDIVINGLSQRYEQMAQLKIFTMKVHYNPE